MQFELFPKSAGQMAYEEYKLDMLLGDSLADWHALTPHAQESWEACGRKRRKTHLNTALGGS